MWALHWATMKIAAVQFVSTGDTKANLELACEHIEEAASHGARLIVLPEATSQSFASGRLDTCLLYTSPSPRDATLSRMPSSA